MKRDCYCPTSTVSFALGMLAWSMTWLHNRHTLSYLRPIKRSQSSLNSKAQTQARRVASTNPACRDPYPANANVQGWNCARIVTSLASQNNYATRSSRHVCRIVNRGTVLPRPIQERRAALVADRARAPTNMLPAMIAAHKCRDRDLNTTMDSSTLTRER